MASVAPGPQEDGAYRGGKKEHPDSRQNQHQLANLPMTLEGWKCRRPTCQTRAQKCKQRKRM